MELKVTRYDVADGVATITLSRPERLNAWTGRMHAEYRFSLKAAESDPAVRVVVVTGEGRGFCAGADTTALGQLARKGEYDPGVLPETLARPGYGVRPEYDHPFAFQFGIPKPLIAAVNGAAAGIGFVLACFCDIRFAAAGAKLTTSSGRLGLPAEAGLSWVLPRIIGIAHANDLLFSSRVVLAEEAERMGLVNRVFPPDELRAETHRYAQEVASSISPASLRESKWQVYADLHRDVGSAIVESERLMSRMLREPDFEEGTSAWAAHRAPRFVPRPP